MHGTSTQKKFLLPPFSKGVQPIYGNSRRGRSNGRLRVYDSCDITPVVSAKFISFESQSFHPRLCCIFLYPAGVQRFVDVSQRICVEILESFHILKNIVAWIPV